MKSTPLHRHHTRMLCFVCPLALAVLFALPADRPVSAQVASCHSAPEACEAAHARQFYTPDEIAEPLTPADSLAIDSDGDGLIDADEFENGTDPHVSDTDGDGLPDLWEVESGLNAQTGMDADGASGDPDRDGIANLDEYNQQTDPLASPPLHLLLPFIVE